MEGQNSQAENIQLQDVDYSRHLPLFLALSLITWISLPWRYAEMQQLSEKMHDPKPRI